MHVWTTETQKLSARKAWLAQLDEISALTPGTPLDAGSIAYTRGHLQRFEAESTKAAKVSKGEMKW